MDVLVVDGDVFTREAMAELLEEKGLGVAQVSSGEVALQVLGASAAVAPKVLVSDVHLGPGRMDDTALAAALHGRWPALGVVVIAGHEKAPDEPDALAGRERRLGKPFPPGALVRAVRELADRSVEAAGWRNAEAEREPHPDPRTDEGPARGSGAGDREAEPWR